MYTIKTTTILTAEQIGDLVASAFEGGSNYWFKPNMVAEFVEPSLGLYASDHVGAGGTVKIVVDDECALYDPTTGDYTSTFEVSGQKVANAIEELVNNAHWTLTDFTDNMDATSADAVLQQVVFGEVIMS